MSLADLRYIHWAHWLQMQLSDVWRLHWDAENSPCCHITTWWMWCSRLSGGVHFKQLHLPGCVTHYVPLRGPLSSSTSLNVDCNWLNSIQCTPCIDQLALDHAAAAAVITFDVTVDLPCIWELLLRLLPCNSYSNLRSWILTMHSTCSQVSGNSGNACIGCSWLLKRFAHSADSINTSHGKPSLFQPNSYYSVLTVLFGQTRIHYSTYYLVRIE